MRPAPLPALLVLLAAPAAACPYGPLGHSHAPVDSPGQAVPLPEGRCAGLAAPPPRAAPPAASPPWDLRKNPIKAEDRPYWELIGYRIDGARLLKDGVVVSSAAMAAAMRPLDLSYDKIDATLWTQFAFAGFRLDETTCRLIGTDGEPLTEIALSMWAASNRKHLAHIALESLLAKLRDLPGDAPVPAGIGQAMLALAAAGTELPPALKELLQRPGTTVAQLRAPAQASYAESTLYFDGQRGLGDFVGATRAGRSPGVARRRKDIVDPVERELGRRLGAAFDERLAQTAPGRELLAQFGGPRGRGKPNVHLLKLTQSSNDPHLAGAYYDPSSDSMIINHWQVVSVARAGLPPEKYKALEARLLDPRKLGELLDQEPSLLPLIVDQLDVTYFHELLHGAQARRNRVADELIRGNLPMGNPLAQEHEAHREHCRYLLSKGAAAIARSGWRDYCLGMLSNPDEFKDRITAMYMSSFVGSMPVDDIAARQRERRGAAREVKSGNGALNWLKQTLKERGFDIGDGALAAYRAEVDARDRAFLDGVETLRRETAAPLVAHYRRAAGPHVALTIFQRLPPSAFADPAGLFSELADETADWIAAASGDPAQRDARLSAVTAIRSRLAEKGWPAGVSRAYERDVRSVVEENLAKAMAVKTEPRRPGGPPAISYAVAERAERERLLDYAAAWAKSIPDESERAATLARIAKAKAAQGRAP